VAGVIATIRGELSPDPLPDNVFQPGLGDVASLLLVTDCCNRVLEEVAGKSWLKASEKEVGSLRDRAIVIIWILRKLQHSHGLNITTPIVIDQMIDWTVFELKAPEIGAALGVDGGQKSRD
jgi:hypothetical protein